MQTIPCSAGAFADTQHFSYLMQSDVSRLSPCEALYLLPPRGWDFSRGPFHPPPPQYSSLNTTSLETTVWHLQVSANHLSSHNSASRLHAYRAGNEHPHSKRFRDVRCTRDRAAVKESALGKSELIIISFILIMIYFISQCPFSHPPCYFPFLTV